ncbi:MAG: phosphatidate cytidylyltransferase [Filifactoraceae bacterium]
MKTRIISAVVLLPFFAYIITKGGIPLAILVSLISLVGLLEYFNLFGNNISKTMTLGTYMVTLIGGISLYIMESNLVFMVMSFSLICFGAILFILRKIKTFDLAISILGYIYISACFGHLILLDKVGSYQYVWLVFIIAFATDTFAYFVGINFGRHKLAPLISPKKSIEGSIGGVIGSIVCCIIYGFIFDIVSPWSLIPIAIIGSIVSQMGDLFASAMKREYGIKDYGNLIPGHGGILDRFDSALFVIPIVYYGVIILEVV